MDKTAQAEGEARVKALLIEPLENRGLAKPAGLARAEFEKMKASLCAKLAYLSDLSLQALEEVAAASPGGKDRDRFPIANTILAQAAVIQPPADDASPLIRAVFAAQLGRDAIAGGWAPELLADLRRNRRWPGSYAVDQIKASADDAARQLIRMEEGLAHGGELTPSEAAWRSRRLAALDKCRAIAALAGDGGAA
jgi:hypothetical protein